MLRRHYPSTYPWEHAATTAAILRTILLHVYREAIASHLLATINRITTDRYVKQRPISNVAILQEPVLPADSSNPANKKTGQDYY